MIEGTQKEPARYGDTIIFPASLDPDAVTVVRRLNEAGLQSYFVGGCVRDLLLGLIPKDFDISTEARPRQIRRLFRNSRIIGRRFKLAHIHFGQKIIEVATFRRTPEGAGDGREATPDSDSGSEDAGEPDGDAGDEGGPLGSERGAPGPIAQHEDLLITRDNEFGTALEDVLRRDFTINALLFDVRTSEVIDYVGGVQDLQARTLRTIGDPRIRFAEDPVRMLRAVKFAARLHLHLHPDVDAALRASADLIRKSAPPRVLEEIFKMLTCGGAERALPLLLDSGLLERLLPDSARYWSGHTEALAATGRALDLVDRGQRRVGNAFLLAALVLRPWHERVADAPGDDPLLPAHDLLDPAARHMSIPRREVAIAKHLLLGLLRTERHAGERARPRRGRRGRSGDHGRGAAEAQDLLYVAALTGVVEPEVHARWLQRQLQAPTGHEGEGEPGGEHAGADEGGEQQPWGREQGEGGEGSRTGRRRRRRGGRRRRGRDREREPARADGSAPPADEGAWSAGSPEPGDAPHEGSGVHDEQDAGEARPEDGSHAGGGQAGERPIGDGTPRRRRGRRGGRRRRRQREGEVPFGPQERPESAGEPRGSGDDDGERDSGADPSSDAEGQYADHETSGSSDAPATDAPAHAGEARAAGTHGDPQREGRGRRGRRRSRGGRGRGRQGDEGRAGAPAEARTGDGAEGQPRPAAASPDTAPTAPRQGGGNEQRGGQQQRGGRGQRGARDQQHRGRRGGRTGREPQPARPSSRSAEDRPKREDDASRGPGQRHPEDVEDFFDW